MTTASLPNHTTLRINADRLQADFEALAAIGATPQGGVHRPTFSDAHLEARRWLRQRLLEAELEFHQDGAGNHSGRLACGPSQAASLLLGSHLDSVPDGGRFDGALGVVAALEVLRVVKESHLQLPVNLEVVDFTDEEGTLFGLLGSRALTGAISTENLRAARGGYDNLLTGLERAGLTPEHLLSARRDPKTLAGYLELHIEQGPRLTRAGIQIGIVTSIVGIASWQIAFIGRADHAGTTPMTERLDAAQGASAFTLAVHQILQEQFAGCTANIGFLHLEPGAFNVVPARAELSLEYRSTDFSTLERLGKALLACAQDQATRYGLGLETHFLGQHKPAPMSLLAQHAIANACQTLGLSHSELPSGAGHDAQSLAELCPAGMIFVPSAAGASHSAREFTPWQDCLNGANTLLQASLDMASRCQPT